MTEKELAIPNLLANNGEGEFLITHKMLREHEMTPVQLMDALEDAIYDQSVSGNIYVSDVPTGYLVKWKVR